MDFQELGFMPTELVFTPHFSKIVAEVKATGLPHVIELWLRIRKGMLLVKYFRPIKVTFYVSSISRGSHDCHRVVVNLATLTFWDITGFKRVLSLSCLCHITNYL